MFERFSKAPARSDKTHSVSMPPGGSCETCCSKGPAPVGRSADDARLNLANSTMQTLLARRASLRMSDADLLNLVQESYRIGDAVLAFLTHEDDAVDDFVVDAAVRLIKKVVG